MRRFYRKSRKGQSMVEYMLAVSVISIALAVGFIELTSSTRDSFKNANLHIQQAYP